MQKLLYLLQVGIVLGQNGWYYTEGHYCITPNNENGQCVQPHKCPLYQPPEGSDKSCGRRGYICCPQTYIDFSEFPPQANNMNCFTNYGDDGTCRSRENCEKLDLFLNSTQDNRYGENFNRICLPVQPTDQRENLYCCPSDNVIDNNDIHYNPHHEPVQDVRVQPNECGLRRINQHQFVRIARGKNAVRGEWPWIASLTNINYGHICGGSIITKRHILTAAHCIINDGPLRIAYARLGAHDFLHYDDTGRDVYPILKAIRHEKYLKYDFYADIGIVYLNKEIQFTDYIQPICLPNQTHDNYFGKSWVAGWGKAINEQFSNVNRSGYQMNVSYHKPNILQDAQLNIVDNTVCKELGAHPARLFDETFLCAASFFNKHVCSGDSGGPLIISEQNQNQNQHYLIGVVSAGPTICGTINATASVFTKVIHYIPWIENKISNGF